MATARRERPPPVTLTPRADTGATLSIGAVETVALWQEGSAQPGANRTAYLEFQVDDIDAASLVRPALTTVRIPAEEIGRAAGELLLHRIAEGMTSTHRHVLVQHKLIIRESA